MRCFNKTLVVALFAIVLVPPWQVKWVDPATGIAPFVAPEQQEFAGFHFWGYAPIPATKVIAWDGVNIGGKVEVKAIQSVKISLFLSEVGVLGFLWSLLLLFGRRRNVAA